MRFALALLLVALGLGAAARLWVRVSRYRPAPARRVVAVTLAAAGAAVAVHFLTRAMLVWTEIAPDRATGTAAGALAPALLWVAPLGEAAKAGVLWPLYLRRRLGGARLGLLHAGAAGAGYGAAWTALHVLFVEPTPAGFGRGLVALPGHVFFAGAWGYALGEKTARGRWFVVSWTLATLLHGVCVHLTYGRAPSAALALLPLLVGMAALTAIALRDVAPSDRQSWLGRASLLSTLPEPPSLAEMSRALVRRERPLALGWVAIGALVTLGVVIVSLTAAIVLGQRLHVDFTLASEPTFAAAAPVSLLGGATFAAFPVAGYLVARASGATVVTEPALGAVAAILVVVLLLVMTAPVAVVFAIAAAPVAFALACTGAWFGVVR